MVVVKAALFSIANIVINIYFSQKAATAGFALAAERDILTNGLIALAKACFRFLTGILL